jgi:hypothetical protein
LRIWSAGRLSGQYGKTAKLKNFLTAGAPIYTIYLTDAFARAEKTEEQKHA